jgi:hypothetical protein
MSTTLLPAVLLFKVHMICVLKCGCVYHVGGDDALLSLAVVLC